MPPQPEEARRDANALPQDKPERPLNLDASLAGDLRGVVGRDVAILAGAHDGRGLDSTSTPIPSLSPAPEDGGSCPLSIFSASSFSLRSDAMAERDHATEAYLASTPATMSKATATPIRLSPAINPELTGTT